MANDKVPSKELLITQIVNAWTVPGNNPMFHQDMQTWVRQNWPTLARSIDMAAHFQAQTVDTQLLCIVCVQEKEESPNLAYVVDRGDSLCLGHFRKIHN